MARRVCAKHTFRLIVREVQALGGLEEFLEIGVVVLLVVAADGDVIQIREGSP